MRPFKATSSFLMIIAIAVYASSVSASTSKAEARETEIKAYKTVELKPDQIRFMFEASKPIIAKESRLKDDPGRLKQKSTAKDEQLYEYKIKKLEMLAYLEAVDGTRVKALIDPSNRFIFLKNDYNDVIGVSTYEMEEGVADVESYRTVDFKKAEEITKLGKISDLNGISADVFHKELTSEILFQTEGKTLGVAAIDGTPVIGAGGVLYVLNENGCDEFNEFAIDSKATWLPTLLSDAYTMSDGTIAQVFADSLKKKLIFKTGDGKIIGSARYDGIAISVQDEVLLVDELSIIKFDVENIAGMPTPAGGIQEMPTPAGG